ncbi:MAG: HEAT repeat domain-containing protein [Goleter apudmare HA4340-LM2]|jgi:predicted NACHT family NTPase|nr:HEAT repeat domain-containing protein [Goleter apudmare HA4340-LM2]
MARPSYGPEAKKRSRRLLEALLIYANDEIDCRDESVLDALRPQIQTRWQSEKRLVVRTKVRFLQVLTTLEEGKTQLTIEQIKEALKRFADFLQILEDNRPSRGGSETWHFTLNLWHHRQNITANLQQFDLEWEQRRPEKSQQVTKATAEKAEIFTHLLPDWQEICRANLAAQNHSRLTTNPLTSADGITFELNQVYVPLGLVERKQRQRYRGDVSPQEGSRLYEPEDAEFTQTFDHKQFFQQVLHCKQSRRIAIVGEPGAGKTTLLQRIAAWVLDNTEDLAIWVSLADLQGKTLEQYLIQDWLPSATRKLRVPPEIAEAFCEQFNQGRVWLLLDAVDEMAIASSQALAKIASFLTGWVADATVILTCRLNIWDAGKNALESFDTYRNLNFTDSTNQVGQFIHRWFQDNPHLGESLQIELKQPERRRLQDAVKNPLRLALLCRIWGLGRGEFPHTKAMLYEQFVETIYEWKQDRFPTTSAQQKELNQALGELALLAIAQEKTKFRLRHRFVCQVLGNPDDGLFQLVLQLGWLNQVGISETQGEKVYAFYHPTFQEYFAARALTDWHFFLNHILEYGNSPPPAASYRIFESQWREVILLWLGRDDIPQVDKEEFIQALIEFDDRCGGYYRYQAYFLAAQGIAEFADCPNADHIVQQLIEWRFGYFHAKKQKWCRYPAPIIEGARVALLKTDRSKAIAALEEFVQSSQNLFNCWNAAYSLGKVFDPGNKIAITALEQLTTTVRHESIRWQAAYHLGRVDAANPTAITALVQIIATTKHESTRRKAAYSLGKIDGGNAIALSTLEQIAASATDPSQRRQAAANLKTLHFPEPCAVSKSLPSPSPSSPAPLLSSLIHGIHSCENEETRRRRAYKLAQLDPGNSLAFSTLLQLLKSTNSQSVRKHTTENLKEIILNEQMPALIAALKDDFDHGICESESEQLYEYYKLIWHCAETMEYVEFYQIWHH